MCKEIKSYTENGLKYRFDREKLDMFILQKREQLLAQKKKAFKITIIRELAEVTFVSEEAVKSWMYGNNGPSDLEQVKKIADYFGVDYHELLKQEENKVNTENNIYMEQISEKVKLQTHASVRDIYVAMFEAVDKIWEYYHAEDTGIIMEYSEEELLEKNITTFERAQEACDKVVGLFNKYFLDIPRSLEEKMWSWFFRNVKEELMSIAFSFMDPVCPDDPEEVEELEQASKRLKKEESKYKQGFYCDELKKIVSDYVLP